ncbi:MAG: RHS repeat domain-containing protein [Limisphaerales bacterium]|jgi:RHS repeat-associated protein
MNATAPREKLLNHSCQAVLLRGIGGLLMVNAGSGGVHFPAYDLNGNVMGLVSAADGIISAKYEYGPFGEVFCSVGDMAKVSPFQFSTKYTDSETDLVYYGYRYYSPALGRWLSRDPIEEQGGLNLYGFVNNDPVNKWDKLGLSFFCKDKCKKGYIRNITVLGYELSSVIHGNRNIVALGHQALNRVNLTGLVHDFGNVTSGIPIKKLRNIIAETISEKGTENLMHFGWQEKILSKLDDIQASILKQDQDVYIYIGISFEKCEYIWINPFKHLDWKRYEKWIQAEVEDERSITGSGIRNDTKSIMKAIPPATKDVLNKAF